MSSGQKTNSEQPVYGDINKVRITGSESYLASWDKMLRRLEEFKIIQIVEAPSKTYPRRDSTLHSAYYGIKMISDIN